MRVFLSYLQITIKWSYSLKNPYQYLCRLFTVVLRVLSGRRTHHIPFGVDERSESWKDESWYCDLFVVQIPNIYNARCVFLFRRKKWFWNSVWFIGKFPTILYILCVIRFPNLEFKTQKLLTRSWQFLWWLFLLCQEVPTKWIIHLKDASQR